MKSIINKKNVDTTKQPLFFGEGLNLQRYDKYRYKKLFDLFLQQLSFFWRPEEVDLSGKEKNDFLTLTEHEKFIFTKNLSYQILLDSVQGRGILHQLREDPLSLLAQTALLLDRRLVRPVGDANPPDRGCRGKRNQRCIEAEAL